MIGMKELKNLLKYILFTPYVVGEKPVSLLIIAETESGKTEVIDIYKYNDGVVYLNDATPYGIVKQMTQLQTAGKKVNHIVVPDLLNPLSKTRVSVQGFIHFFNSATEEGVTKIETAGVHFDIPTIQCGLISAITKDAFVTRKKYWNSIGFLRRMLPFTYRHSIAMSSAILDSIFLKNHIVIEREELHFPREKVDVLLSPELARKMYPYTVRLAKSINVHGYTFQKNFQGLLEGCALSKGKTVVDEEDVKDVQQCAEYMNFDFKKVMKN